MSVPTTSTEPNVHRMMIITTDEDILHQIQTNYNSPSVKSVILNPRKKRNTSSTNDKQSEKRSLICVVCGAPAHGWNFSVITCESCKLFFRRNGLKDPTTLSCRLNNQCEVKIETRRRCIRCRLRKCLESGMKRDRLLKAEEKLTKSPKTSTELENRIEPEVPPCLLTADDLEHIEYIRQSFDKRIELAAQDGFENNLLIVAQDIPDQINTHSVSAFRLLAFFKQIPEFNQINIHDKMILIKYNLMHVIAFNYAVSFRPQADKLHRIDEDVPWNVQLLETVHGQSILADLSRIFRPLISITKRDMKLFPIVFIVFILFKGISTGEGLPEPILEDEMSVYRAQNIFTELLWKYLQTTYGFNAAARIMLSIVTRCISWQVYYLKMRCNIDRLISVTNETKVLPLMKSIFHV